MLVINACPALSSSMVVRRPAASVHPLPLLREHPVGFDAGHRHLGVQFVDLRPQRLHHRPFLGAVSAWPGWRFQGHRSTHGRRRAQRARRRCS